MRSLTLCCLPSCLYWWSVVQHADKLATLERREADLKAQLTDLANDAQELKNKEGTVVLHCPLVHLKVSIT